MLISMTFLWFPFKPILFCCLLFLLVSHLYFDFTIFIVFYFLIFWETIWEVLQLAKLGKTIRDKLVHSKLKKIIYNSMGLIYDCSKFDICNILEKEKQFESIVKKQKHYINFSLDCHSISMVYLLTCKLCQSKTLGPL